MKDILTFIPSIPRLAALCFLACWGMTLQAQTFTFISPGTNGNNFSPDNTCTFAAANKWNSNSVTGMNNCHRLARMTLQYVMDWQTDVYYGLQAPNGRRISLFTGSGWIAGGTHTFNFCDTATQSAADAGFFLNANPYKPDARIPNSSWASRSGVGCATDFNGTFCSFNDLTSDVSALDRVGMPAAMNGTWQIAGYDTWAGVTGSLNPTNCNITFEQAANIVSSNTPIILPLAPGSCTPQPIQCIVPSTACAPSNPVRIQYTLTPVSATCFSSLTGYQTCPPGGVVINMPGTFRLNWRTRAGCVDDTAAQTITIADTEPPQFLPPCPKGGVVNLNAGPGECEVSWDAPNFMAMDNCPYNLLFGNLFLSNGCTAGLQFTNYNGFDGAGNLFNIRNDQNCAINIQAFTAVYTCSSAGTPGIYEFYIKSARNNWGAGIVGGTPGPFSCVGTSPKSLWSLCHTSTPGHGIRTVTSLVAFPPRSATDTFWLGGAPPGGSGNQTKCEPSQTNPMDRLNSTCLTLAAGETVGVALVGAPRSIVPVLFGLGAAPRGGCLATYTDANISINVQDANVPGTGGLGGYTGNTAAQFLAICGGIPFAGNVIYAKVAANPPGMVPVTQTCGQPYGPGSYFPIGCTRLCYEATDLAGNVATCQFDVCVIPYPNTITALACHDEIQISLDENCFATITADEVLSGGPYRCYNDYVVTITDWITGAVIDRQPGVPGVQVGQQDIGRSLKITVRDPQTGNSCWGHATVEDKLPPTLTCPRDTCVPCHSPVDPFYTGTPVVDENCGGVSLTYKDRVTQYGCPYGIDRSITRTWTAIDGSNNKGTCVQIIQVALGTLESVEVPTNYDNIDNPMLNCNEKINKTKDYTPHYLPFPLCVDGYILDSAHWFATGGTIAGGDLSGERLPRALGWNCLDTGRYIGHPSPWPVYYPAHPSWRANNPVCWGPDEVVMWIGTGYPGNAECRNLGITFQDITIDLARPNCDAGPVGCYKVLRQWTVIDWCTSRVGGTNQIIKVADAEGPQILYPDTLIVNMESQLCLGRWEVSPAWLIDNCSNEIHYTVEVEDGVILGNEVSGYVVVNMPAGIQNGWIVAEDCCGNVTQKRIALNVVDNVPPQAICEQHTIVSITGNQTPGNNYAKIFASSFDQGSYDNCANHIFFKAIRMEQLRGTNNGSNTNQPDNGTNCAGVNGDDNAILDGNQIYFDDYINFCCSDVGQTLTVVFRVFDRDPGPGPIAPSRMNPGGNLYNRFNDCMVQVTVQDKTVPTVVAPPNIVVSCWFWFDIDAIDDPNDATFGRVVTDLGQRAKVKTNDLVCYNYCVRNDITGYPGYVPGAPPSNPPAWNRACDYYNSLFDTAHWDRKYELVWGFDGYVLSGCGNTPTISVNDNRECGQGQITRTVVARGPNGISVTASQIIWVVDCDPFYINGADDCDPDDDITWPGNCTGQATTIDGCGADISPDNPLLGRPIVENNADDLCALISIEYVDEIFTIEPDACFKVLRHWTVIDWCQYDPSLDPTKGRWEYLQIIKVHDNDKPEISINIGPCEPAVKNAADNTCYGHISITADATDNCSPLDWLFYDYKIDLFNDGKGNHSGYDFKVGPLTRKQFANNETPLFHHNDYADDENNPFDASGTYPIGIHKICWYVEDGCGNIAARCELFEIKDCKAPTPYCLTGVITVPMPSSGCVTIWAKDLDHGSFDNCTDADDLLFYFDGDPTATSKTICCDDFVAAGANDELFVDVQMWVEDEEGNTDYCKTIIIVQDNQDICPDTGSGKGRVSGELRTDSNDETELANVELLLSSNMMKQITTNATGSYLFGELVPNNYTIKIARNDNHVNGVSTQDIVKIQRHILGIEALNTPYKLIAADVNESKSITASDVSEIRKLVLGVTTEFRRVPSWTFVSKNHNFSNPAAPWDYPRSVNVSVAKDTKLVEDFVAVKYGDVTSNAKGHQVNGSTSRNNGKLHLEIDNNTTVAGEIYKVAFKSSDFTNITGYQFTLKFDRQTLSYEGIESGALELDADNFGTNRVDDGILTTSWNNRVAQSVDVDETLFTVVFRASANSNIGSLLTITSDVTAAEAYDAQLNAKDISLGVRTEKGVVESGIFELYQNTPNPFAKESVISFRLPEAGAVKLSIYDVTGKVLRVYEKAGVKGLNTITVNKSELNTSGVLYYQLDAVNHTATKRMVVID